MKKSSSANHKPAKLSPEQSQSSRILAQVARESETIGTSSLARSTKSPREHFSGTDNINDDAIEIWGKRIGRGLGLGAFVALAIYLCFAYVLK